MDPGSDSLEGKQWPEEHTFAQYGNGPTVSKTSYGGCSTIPWLNCIRVVRISHDLVGLVLIVS